ncbi:TetR/AcrR family transcriptional regulator [Limnovirga soli]|uniref:TetR family transcriptional regulator n=1 Tax=Limnovirga soli TaxID=2656915 RepID=A0A8J8JUP8_9BACT|nr:TetR family transcriptional regulator [Limnovirga soli]NNV56525.1 TetR family transcriptional regulator [Limnovirga soli]
MVVDKREHIIQKSLELFAEKGFEGTSIRDIATLADVNVAMVNYYFGSKEKLFESIVSHRASYMKDMLQELVNDATKTEMEKIDTIIDAYVNRLLSQPAFHRLVHQELLIAKRGVMHEQLINIFASNTLFFKQIIEQGIRKKQFRKVDAELTMASLIGTINQVLLSKSMCNILLQSKEDFNPYTDPVFKKRLIKHLQQMIHAHLTIS